MENRELHRIWVTSIYQPAVSLIIYVIFAFVLTFQLHCNVWFGCLEESLKFRVSGSNPMRKFKYFSLVFCRISR
jgi:hypothetical protein